MDSNGQTPGSGHETAVSANGASSNGVPGPKRRGLSNRVIVTVVLSAVVVAIAAGIVVTLVFVVPSGKSDTGSKPEAGGEERTAPSGETIAFGRCDKGDARTGSDCWIYTIDPDGSNEQRVASVNRAWPEIVPSPDGQKIAFVDGNGVSVVDVDGENLQKLAGGMGVDWTPDGERIVFDDDNVVKSVKPDGSDIQELADGDFARISPDGERIAFLREHRSEVEDDSGGDDENAGVGSVDSNDTDNENDEEEEDYDLYLMDTDGTGVEFLDSHVCDSVDWSPDGDKLAYGSGKDCFDGPMKAYVIDADGSDKTVLVSGLSADPVPAWIPDSSQIAFIQNEGIHVSLVVVNDDGHTQAEKEETGFHHRVSPAGDDIIYFPDDDFGGPKTVRAMNPDGSNDRELLSVDIKSSWQWCDWSPDAGHVVCLDGDDELHVADADGSQPQELTSGGLPTWFTVSQ